MGLKFSPKLFFFWLDYWIIHDVLLQIFGIWSIDQLLTFTLINWENGLVEVRDSGLSNSLY
jgi:hypothetical protein